MWLQCAHLLISILVKDGTGDSLLDLTAMISHKHCHENARATIFVSSQHLFGILVCTCRLPQLAWVHYSSLHRLALVLSLR